ncbi:hypothetical protein GCM10011351_07490 [Paraliobacillus quinghaiensis]|uniref:Response regulator n=1 Tax=Paraliobacillus quinghaiensis TaxID=470815 RepID=A0A917WS84_9BACI|nr:response regulator [Paraliobacillus quinghaiensis]GGM24222.1 hypothetical protein GCM10011351_07490 [Paraliobacillus quinghaiensis]
MKALIIDDEKHVREGLILLANWENVGITCILEAADGLEAKKLIQQHKPEIIFTDMHMPKCDGIQLIKWLYTSECTSKIIAVSGYDDFKYMKNAITYGIFDYLLKPININDLNETLSKAVKEWKEQNKVRLSNKIHDQAIWDHQLSNVLDKPNPPLIIVDYIKEKYDVNIVQELCTIGLFSIKMYLSKHNQEDTRSIISSILTICNDKLSKYKKGIAFRNINKEDEIVLLLWQLNEEHYVINQIILQIKQETNINCFIALGEPALQLVDTYQSAREIYKTHNLMEVDFQSIVTKQQTNDSFQTTQLFDYTEEIKWAMQSGSMEQLDKILKKIFTTFQKNNCFTMEQLELWESQFNILKEHWLKEYEINKSDHIYIGTDYWNENGSFNFNKFQEEKRREFYDLLTKMHHVHFRKEKSSVQLIEEYIKNNFQKDITLSDIAERFYLSREYISRKFKKQFNKTITDYITQLRIEKSKELLKNPHLKVYEVGSSVGYKNDKYFIKVFKKIEGITPREYADSTRTTTNTLNS